MSVGSCCLRSMAPLLRRQQRQRAQHVLLFCGSSLGFVSRRRHLATSVVARTPSLHLVRRLVCSSSEVSSPSQDGKDLSKVDDYDGDDHPDDPVAPFLAHFHPTSLTQLAKQLPDEVMEGLESGLRRHLERFPTRYRLFNAPNGLLQVQRMREVFRKCGRTCREPAVMADRKRISTPTPPLAACRIVQLASLIRLYHMSCLVDSCETSKGINGMEKSEDDVDEMELFIREHLLNEKGSALWLLTAEYTVEECQEETSNAKEEMKDGESVGVTGKGRMPRCTEGKEVLQAFRWVRLVDARMVDDALHTLRSEIRSVRDKREAHPGGSSSIMLTRSTLYARSFLPDVCASEERPEIADGAVIIEDYNVYRMCRALDTKTFVKLPELQDVVGDCLTQPLPAILAVVGEEKRQTESLSDSDNMGRSILEFERDPTDATRIVGVRFWLDEARYLPCLYLEKSYTELQNELIEFTANIPKNISKLPNHKRVRLIDKKRLLMRCIALHELGPSPLCHPDVLAYYVFDSLPLDGQLIMKGHLPQLLADDIRRITDARCRTWLKAYPHLFRLVEHPPEMFVQRTDAIIPKSSYDLQQQQEWSFLTGPSKQGPDYHKQLLTDPEEQLRFVVSIVAARLDACRTKKLLPSHIPKFMCAELRRAIMPRNSGGILRYLERHPDVFILTYGAHPNEPVVTLASSLSTNLKQERTESAEC